MPNTIFKQQQKPAITDTNYIDSTGEQLQPKQNCTRRIMRARESMRNKRMRAVQVNVSKRSQLLSVRSAANNYDASLKQT